MKEVTHLSQKYSMPIKAETAAELLILWQSLFTVYTITPKLHQIEGISEFCKKDNYLDINR